MTESRRVARPARRRRSAPALRRPRRRSATAALRRQRRRRQDDDRRRARALRGAPRPSRRGVDDRPGAPPERQPRHRRARRRAAPRPARPPRRHARRLARCHAPRREAHLRRALIRRYAPSDAAAERVLANRIYQSISTALAGSQEYMAMERLHAIASEGRYDLLVVDTPPTHHALDFLEAPERLTALLSSRAAAILQNPTSDPLARELAPRAGGARRGAARPRALHGTRAPARRRRVRRRDRGLLERLSVARGGGGGVPARAAHRVRAGDDAGAGAHRRDARVPSRARARRSPFGGFIVNRVLPAHLVASPPPDPAREAGATPRSRASSPRSTNASRRSSRPSAPRSRASSAPRRTAARRDPAPDRGADVVDEPGAHRGRVRALRAVRAPAGGDDAGRAQPRRYDPLDAACRLSEERRLGCSRSASRRSSLMLRLTRLPCSDSTFESSRL